MRRLETGVAKTECKPFASRPSRSRCTEMRSAMKTSNQLIQRTRYALHEQYWPPGAANSRGPGVDARRIRGQTSGCGFRHHPRGSFQDRKPIRFCKRQEAGLFGRDLEGPRSGPLSTPAARSSPRFHGEAGQNVFLISVMKGARSQLRFEAKTEVAPIPT